MRELFWRGEFTNNNLFMVTLGFNPAAIAGDAHPIPIRYTGDLIVPVLWQRLQYGDLGCGVVVLREHMQDQARVLEFYPMPALSVIRNESCPVFNQDGAVGFGFYDQI